MTRRTFDVDIDVSSGTDKSKYGVRAMIYNEDQEKVMPHPSGFYLEPVPVDNITGTCAFTSSYGEEHGFMKVDLLTNTSYDKMKDKEEILNLIEVEPDWKQLEDREVVESLPHIAKHYDTVTKVRPRSVDDLADLLALIRPGKIHLVDRYLEDKEATRKVLYKRADKAYFKKSHSYSYAMMIVVLLNKKKMSQAVFW